VEESVPEEDRGVHLARGQDGHNTYHDCDYKHTCPKKSTDPDEDILSACEGCDGGEDVRGALGTNKWR
jgi:hypothetical protein